MKTNVATGATWSMTNVDRTHVNSWCHNNDNDDDDDNYNNDSEYNDDNECCNGSNLVDDQCGQMSAFSVYQCQSLS